MHLKHHLNIDVVFYGMDIQVSMEAYLAPVLSSKDML